METKTEITTALPIPKVIKMASCPTLTGTSELSYNIGIDEQDELLFLISNNTGGGYFNREWIAYKDVQAALTGRTISSIPLRQLFKGKRVVKHLRFSASRRSCRAYPSGDHTLSSVIYWLPVVWQQFMERTGFLCRESSQHVFQVCIGLMSVQLR